MTGEIDAVVFDIGNVLIEWQPERYYDSVIGEARRRAMFDEVDLHALNDRVDLGQGFRDVIYDAADGYPKWRDEIRLWHDHWLEMAQPVIAHSVKLMEALQARGVPVFSLTNFGIETYALAATQYGFLNRFDRDFISGHLGLIKPDPAIYEAVEATSGVAPGRLLFTDDRADNVAAARARGWQVHQFEGPEGWAAQLVARGLLTEEEAAP